MQTHSRSKWQRDPRLSLHRSVFTVAAGRLLRLAATAMAVIAAAAPPASAQWAPSTDVEFVVPFGVGGGADLLARTVTKIIQDERLVPVNISVVNKPGGGTAVGVSYVAATKGGDPHTLVLINPQTQITPLRVADARGWRDLTPIANLLLDDYILLAPKSSEYADVASLVAAAKSKEPRAISIGSAGTADDMAIALLEAAAGIKLNIVRFDSGGEVLTAMLGRHVDLAAGNPLEFMGHLKNGEAKALGVFRDKRFEALPEAPTLAEQGIQAENFQMWRGIALPADVPPEAVRYWSDVMRKVAESQAYRDYVTANFATWDFRDPEAFRAFLEKQEAIYSELLQKLGTEQ